MSPETRDISILEPIIAAHHYGEFSADFLWDTVTDDIDELRDYCKACIRLSAAQILQATTKR
jgi:uncharacterized protein with HEPN domain